MSGIIFTTSIALWTIAAFLLALLVLTAWRNPLLRTLGAFYLLCGCIGIVLIAYMFQRSSAVRSYECHLGSPVRENCTPGSAWGDESKKPGRLGEGTGAKASATARLRKDYRFKARLYHPHRSVGRALATATSPPGT
jgi:hypothetical protein